MFIVATVIKTGRDLLSDAMRVLLDASLDGEALLRIDVALVKRSLRGKGPVYVFRGTGVVLRESDKETLAEAIASQWSPLRIRASGASHQRSVVRATHWSTYTKMQDENSFALKIVGAESLGTRSLCCAVELEDHRIFIDPGLALGYFRHGRHPHPVQLAVG